jgi:hypothetical protein
MIALPVPTARSADTRRIHPCAQRHCEALHTRPCVTPRPRAAILRHQAVPRHADRGRAGGPRAAGGNGERLCPRTDPLRILLEADQGPRGPAWADAGIAAALDVSVPTVERVRQRFLEHGLDAANRPRRPRREYRTTLDPCGPTTLDLAAAGRQAGRSALHRRCLTPDGPPGAQQEQAEAVAHQALGHPAGGERRVRVAHGGPVGGLHAPYAPHFPQVCLDEVSKRLIAETRCPLPMEPGRPAR